MIKIIKFITKLIINLILTLIIIALSYIAISLAQGNDIYHTLTSIENFIYEIKNKDTDATEKEYVRNVKEFTAEERLKYASYYHISTSNEEINNIVNKMLDTIVMQHTIESESRSIDFNNRVIKINGLNDTNENIYYIDFNANDTEKIEIHQYEISNDDTYIANYEVNESFLEFFLTFSYKTSFGQATMVEIQDASIDKTDTQYIINIIYNEGKDILYINKNNYLLEKFISARGEINNYKYTNNTIELPKGYENANLQIMGKPVIYLYPEETINVKASLQLNNNIKLKTTYPKYNNGWNVTATPESKLTDASGRSYDYLFYDAYTSVSPEIKEGFVVKGSKSIEFLEDVLNQYGLTEKEANEFIVYWAPYLEENEYNLISFQNKWYDEQVKLKITPQPDSILRLFMVYEPLKEAIEIEEQKITPFERKDFTVVEWGGMKNK